MRELWNREGFVSVGVVHQEPVVTAHGDVIRECRRRLAEASRKTREMLIPGVVEKYPATRIVGARVADVDAALAALDALEQEAEVHAAGCQCGDDEACAFLARAACAEAAMLRSLRAANARLRNLAEKVVMLERERDEWRARG
jgi:hypothetical protein